MWHITKREIYDNLNSLRFALTTVLLLALMVTNAVKHLREHPKRVQRYRDAVTESLNHLTDRANDSSIHWHNTDRETSTKSRLPFTSVQTAVNPFYLMLLKWTNHLCL